MGLRNYLIEGMSGAGKSAVWGELVARGFNAINGGRELAYRGDLVTGKPLEGVTGIALHDVHLWSPADVRRLAADTTHEATFFCGGSRNWAQFIDVFDAVFVLTIGAQTLRQRLATRDADDWAGAGRDDEKAFVYQRHADGGGTPPGTQIDAERPLAHVVDDILDRAALPRRAAH